MYPGGGGANEAMSVAIALVVPALLARASGESENESGRTGEVYRETSSRLLELASANQVAFRAVVAGMNEAQKGFMEEVIKNGRLGSGQSSAARAGTGRSDAGQPSIALKMDFGG